MHPSHPRHDTSGSPVGGRSELGEPLERPEVRFCTDEERLGAASELAKLLAVHRAQSGATSAAQAAELTREFVARTIGSASCPPRHRVVRLGTQHPEPSFAWCLIEGRIATIIATTGESVGVLTALESFLEGEGCSSIRFSVFPSQYNLVQALGDLEYATLSQQMIATVEHAGYPNDIELRTMTSSEFAAFRDWCVGDYSASLSDLGLSENEANEQASSIVDDLLPRGLETPDHNIFSAWEGETKVGEAWIAIRQNGAARHAEGYFVHVFPEYRRRGLGKGLLFALGNAAVDANVDTVSLNVFGSNEPALRLYENAGFRVSQLVSGRLAHSREETL